VQLAENQPQKQVQKDSESTFWFSTSEVFQTREHSSLSDFKLLVNILRI